MVKNAQVVLLLNFKLCLFIYLTAGYLFNCWELSLKGQTWLDGQRIWLTIIFYF